MKYIYTALILFFSIYINAEDGSKLWLRFQGQNVPEIAINSINGDKDALAIKEFQTALNEIFDTHIPISKDLTNNSVIIAKKGDKLINDFSLSKDINALSSEGYIIRSINRKGNDYTVLAAQTDEGLLYGTYHLLRLIQTEEFSNYIDIIENPSYQLRLLNHWDNLNRTVERGYAGYSIWKWDELPQKVSPLYKQYAQANASIGINGVVLNNVNATPEILTAEYLDKVKVISNELRPYNIKVYLSINFSSPSELGGLKDSDPLNAEVQKWWKEKAKEIYKLIPDFGGFLVKANSEGLPGPMDYGRNHADGANMLADALKPHGGIVMWRAFVYDPDNDDRAKQAYSDFMPLDGKFRDNVIVQIKNGPVDFQPREPFNPLFGAMQKTAVMPELQITQEYLGFSNHLVFLSSLWEEFFKSDTYCKGKGSTVARVTDGTIFKIGRAHV